MIKKHTSRIAAVAFITLFSLRVGRAEESGNNPRHDLAESLESAKITLAQGLEAAQAKGKPISGKFEIEDGKLQLSVYVAKDDSFSEVVVDHKSGKVAKAETITTGDDLTAAKAQSEAMAKAKSSLAVAVKKAVKANKGFMAVSVTPSLMEGHPAADVNLLNDEGQEMKTITEKLD